MILLVTGAAGFVGRHVVREALRRGHDVRATDRRTADARELNWETTPRLEIVRADLCRPDEVRRAVAGADAVIHLAAVKTGALDIQRAGTVDTTKNLLEAMTEAGVSRLVAVSTFSVYDFLRLRSDSTLDETAPLEASPENRESYARAKLLQESLIERYAAENGLQVTIVRPAAIYGPDHCWTDQLGIRFGDRIWLRFGGRGRLGLTYVENCAEAIVLAAETEESVGQVLNVVDDDRPTRRHYARELRSRLPRRPVVIRVPGSLVRFLAGSAEAVNRFLLRGRARLPWFLAPAKLHVQLKPLRFSNDRIRAVINWSPRYSLVEALDRSFAPGPAGPGTTGHHPLREKTETR